jgi:hypothetical protein
MGKIHGVSKLEENSIYHIAGRQEYEYISKDFELNLIWK